MTDDNEPGLSEPATRNIKEVIPKKYRGKYEKWKEEFLSTESGREQWERYARDSSFTLTITVSKKEGEGAKTGDYKWDGAGKLIAATITLGHKIDSGYPNPVGYPITCSLASDELPISGRILAATKFAHEFGHVNRTAGMDASLYQLQNRLMLEYRRIFYANGRNTKDPQLIEISRWMEGTPVEIWRDREHWAEANAILYLRERFPGGEERLSMPLAIRQAIDSYYMTYPERLIWLLRSLKSAASQTTSSPAESDVSFVRLGLRP